MNLLRGLNFQKKNLLKEEEEEERESCTLFVTSTKCWYVRRELTILVNSCKMLASESKSLNNKWYEGHSRQESCTFLYLRVSLLFE